MTNTALRLGRYQLQDQIAAGGMGEVWRGVDTVLERPVAVKLLRAEHARQAEAVARFRSEARHAALVSHPAIAAVHDFGEASRSRRPYLVMELVEGPSLAAVLSAGPLDVARARAGSPAGAELPRRAGVTRGRHRGGRGVNTGRTDGRTAPFREGRRATMASEEH